jgi:hypothetical protein
MNRRAPHSRMAKPCYPLQARCGEANGMARLSEEDVLSIVSDPRTQHELAHEYRVHQATIADIRRGATWLWLTGPLRAGSR